MINGKITSTSRIVACKYCGSKAVVKFGFYRNVQRYWCKVCRRKFKDDNTDFHMKVSSSYVVITLNKYYQGILITNTPERRRGYFPSKNAVYKWIKKYTLLLSTLFSSYSPVVSDCWIIYESKVEIDGNIKEVLVCDIIDSDTKFLLASQVDEPSQLNMKILIREAARKACKLPETIYISKQSPYLEILENLIGKGNLVQVEPSANIDVSELSGRYNGTTAGRKVIRSFKNIDVLRHFVSGWLFYYNFFKPQKCLEGKTPAEKAKIKYSIKTWSDLVKSNKCHII